MVYEAFRSVVLGRIVEPGLKVAKYEHSQRDAAGQKLKCPIEASLWSQVVLHPPGETTVGEVLSLLKRLTSRPVLTGTPDALENHGGRGLRIAEQGGKLLDFEKELLL